MKKNLKYIEHLYILLRLVTVSYSLIILITFFSMQTFAQKDTVYVPSDIPPGEGNLNDSINAQIGNLSNVVYKLEANGYYVLTDSIYIPEEEHLTIVAPDPGNTQQTSPPQILVTVNSYPSKYFFYSNGDLTIKNIWLLYAASDEWQRQISLQFDNSDETDTLTGIFENVIFDFSGVPQNGGGAVCISSKHFLGSFKNCYFKNCTDAHFRYYGRAVSFPYNQTGYHIDSLSFENCTFANIGYVYSQQGDWISEGQYADNIHFNHCTFLNVVMFSLESGWWYKMSVTNSIFVNTFMFGDIPAYRHEPNGGTIRIDSVSNFGFEVPFTEQDRRILFTNSNYFIEDWLADWMKINPGSQWLDSLGRYDEIPVPQPMLNPGTIEFFNSASFPYMNKSNLHDSTDPGFILHPTNYEKIKDFLEAKWFSAEDYQWAYKPEMSFQRIWPMEEDLSYTNEVLKTAGMGGFPLGDLYHWFPNEYMQWKAQEGNENARISYWLNNGQDSIFTDVKENYDFVKNYKLFQNYPNPFNLTTLIRYSVPKESYTSIKVYNLLGEEIAVLFEGYQKAGNFTATFDGIGLTSGVYFYQIQAENFIDTKKLILLK